MNTFNVQVVNASEFAAVELLSKSLKKGAAVRVVTFKETKMNKGTKNNRNELLGCVMERTTIGGWQVGTSYENSCNNAAERSGSDSQFNGKENWHTYFNDFFQVDKKTASKFYLQLQKSKKTGCSKDTDYFVNGKPATAEQEAYIKSWLPKSNKEQSSSQVEAGIDKEHERDYILIALSNIESVEQGDFTYRIEKQVEHTAEVER
jgi:hypothetical protein